MPSAKILIAEDNQALAAVLRFNLENAGYDVTVVGDGASALAMVQDNQFDVILTDQQMPKMTGYEFCVRMRELEDYATVPTIMLTAKGLELEITELKAQLGLTATFIKPFSPSAVVKTVESCLHEASQQQI